MTNRRARSRQALWLVIALVALALVVATLLAAVSLSDPLGLDGIVPSWLSTWLDTSLVVGLAVLTVALLGLAYSLDQYRLRALAFRPGPVTIQIESDERARPHRDQVGETLRAHLRANRLMSHTLDSGEAGDSSYLERLARTDSRVVASLLAIVHLFRRPGAPYIVTITLSRHEGVGDSLRCGILVKTTALPGGETREIDVRGADWQEAAVLAGNEVCRQILPRTRLWNEEPWRSWRNDAAAAPSFPAFQRAKLLIAERRFDEALDALYEALDADGGNIELRRELAAVQERLGLYVDALLTLRYAIDLIDRQHPRPSSIPRRQLIKRSRRRFRYWLGAADRDLFDTRYRYADTLATVEKTAAQWCETRVVGPRRRSERARVRSELAAFLEEDAALDHSFPNEEFVDVIAFGSEDEGRHAGSDIRVRRSKADEFFIALSRYELATLQTDLGLLTRRRSRSTVTKRSIRLARLWTTVRRERLRVDESESRLVREPAVRRDVGHDQERVSSYMKTAEFEPEGLRAAIRSAVGRRRLFLSGMTWKDWYDIACIYAVAIPDTFGTERSHRHPHLGPLASEDDLLARWSIGHLERALDSVTIEERDRLRDLVLVSDPDLAVLRTQPRFRTFERTNFPRKHSPPSRPRLVHRFETSRYVSELVAAAATHVTGRWSDRRRQLSNGVLIDDLRQWWDDEERVLEALADTVANPRDWRSRLNLIRTSAAQRPLDDLGMEAPRYPRFADLELEGDAEEVAQNEDRREQRANADLGTVAEHVPTISKNVKRWQTALGQADDEYVQKNIADIDAWIRASSSEWESLGRWFRGERAHAKTYRMNASRLPPAPTTM